MLENNALFELWKSTADLHERFFPDDPPGFDARWRVFFEELSEFLAEVTMPSELSDGAELSEAADLLVTLIGLLQLRGATFVEFEAALNGVARKNNAKTHETHEVNASGKIARKQKAP